ncbi:MAG: methionine--tRNA ligase [Candidatus Sericytochromatia bacterium]
MKDNYYITTAIDYSNAPPHLGHAYEKITADFIARHQRMRGKDVFFITGVDEHGTKNEKASKERNMTPQEHCDDIAEKYKETWAELGISYDYFIRTTDELHKKAVIEIFLKLQAQGDIYKKKYEGLYCSGCEAFYLEKDLLEGNICPVHNRATEIVAEENYFFNITKYKEKIKQHILNNPNFIRPESKKNEILNMIDDFQDISISRETVKWGIPVPNDEKQVLYVWIDALNNYITGLGFFGGRTEDLKKYWPADVQIVGKDILKFHAIIWPAILLALDLPLPKTIFSHGFITIGGSKISKTTGNVIKPKDLADKYQADGLRYFIIRELNYGNDGNFDATFKEDKSFDKCEPLENRVNSDLANNLGNSLNRIVASILAKNCNGIIPERLLEAEKDFPSFVEEIKNRIANHMDNFEIQEAVSTTWELVNKLNKYIDTEAPWTLAKKALEDESTKPYFHGVLYTCLETLRIVSLLAYPIVPNIAKRIWNQLGINENIDEQKWDKITWGLTKAGAQTQKGEIVYPRIDSKLADKAKK